MFSGVRVTLSLVLCVCFLDFCLSMCPFSFGHCVVCPLIYGFGLSLWYLQTLDKRMNRPSTDSMFATKFSRSIIIGQRFYWCSFIFYHCKILCNPKMLWVFRSSHCCFLFVDTISSHNLSDRNFKKMFYMIILGTEYNFNFVPCNILFT